MNLLPLFTEKCDLLAKDRGKKFASWYEDGLVQCVRQLVILEGDVGAPNDMFVGMEHLLAAWVVGNNGLDARMVVAWRAVGADLGYNLVDDLIPIENGVGQGLLMMTGHEKAKAKRWTSRQTLRVAIATLVGGGLLAAGGVVAAPIVGTIAASGGAASTAAFLHSAAGIGAVAAAMGVFGGQRTAWKMVKRDGGLKEFLLVPTVGNKSKVDASSDKDDATNRNKPRRDSTKESSEVAEHGQKMHCIIGVSGWLEREEMTELDLYWSKALGAAADSDPWTLAFDRKILVNYGTALRKFVVEQGVQSLALHAAAIAGGPLLMAAASAPSMALMVQDVVDSPFAVAKSRAKLAGIELARALMGKALGNRPVTLVGFGFGATTIVACLEELAKEETNDCEGLIQDVVIFGSPIKISVERWRAATRCVAGKFINCYNKKDYMLALLLRLSTKMHPTAGVSPIEVEGITNREVSSTGYEIGTIPGLIDTLLREVLYAGTEALKPEETLEKQGKE